MAVDGAGDVVAVWSRLEGTDTIAQAAFRSSGGAWESADDLSEAGGDATEPQIAVDPGGGAVAVWSRDGRDAWGRSRRRRWRPAASGSKRSI